VSGQWYNYAYIGTSASNGNVNLPATYAGYYISTGLNVNTEDKWGNSLSPSYALEYTGICVPTDNHTVSSVRKGFPCGNYTLSIGGHDDDVAVFVNGVKIFGHAGCCDAHNTIWTGNLGPDDKVEIRHAEGVGASYHSLNFTTNATYADAVCTAPACDVAYVDPTISLDATGPTAGSPANPYKFISSAAGVAAVTYIRVAKGSGTEANIVNIPNNCVIEGGYVRSGTGNVLWTKSSASADITSITFSGLETVSGVQHIVAFKSDGKSNWTVKDLDITTANTPASTYDGSNRGMSNYGFLIINNSQNYTLSRLNITVGNAGAGANGTTPAGTGGGYSGGAGGTSSAGCKSKNCTSTAGKAGNAGTGAGGVGAGSGTNTNGGPSVKNGSTCFNSQPGKEKNGKNGTTSANGYTGATGNVGSAYDLSSSYFIPGGVGSTGINGGGGQGGGSGSGNAAGSAVCVACDVEYSGAGGKGGTGGTGGTGGYGGGGAFGIWEKSSTGTIFKTEINITNGGAGGGGAGATGSAGIAGTAGGSGDCNSLCIGSATCAGNGSQGGTGGTGGTGGAGAAGTSAAMVVNGTSTATLTATIPFTTTISIDNFSQRSNLSGKMCKNSEIELTRTSGSSWVIPPAVTPIDLAFVNDKTSTTSSYNTSSTSIKVTTNSSNISYDISDGTTLLKKFLYVASDSRTLPQISITPASKYICLGDAIGIDKTSSYDEINIKEYEYVVFKDGADALNPYQSGSFNSNNGNYTTPPFTETGKYWVRYRERHNCCGWSRPVFESFNVIALPTAGAIGVKTETYCSGSISNVTPGTGTGAITYRWESSTTDAVSGFSTVAGETNATLSPTITATTWFRRYTVSASNTTCESAPTNVVQLYANTDNTGVLATTNSSKTCTVSGSQWHYFRNTAGEIIAAINSNGKNLGNVTMEVTIATATHDGSFVSPKHGNGGIGNARVCLGQPELSMRRWYRITVYNQPSGTPSSVKLFFTSEDYDNYAGEIALWTNYIAPTYGWCYGYTSSAGDLVVSKDETYDLNPSPTPSVGGGPGGSTEYQIAVPSFSTFRFHTLGGKGEALPVELVSFTGWNQGSVNKLQWVTASELHSDKYEIEKSTVSGVWNTIGDVRAAGNSNIKLTYNFTDNNPVVGDNYYRLKMIDIDGTFKYSNTINIPISEAITNGFVGVYPNPTGGELNVDIQSVGLYDTYVSVYDVLGKTIFEKPVTIVRGMNKLQFNFNQLAKGTYILRFADAQGTLHSTKFVKD
jgi:hypothetical protein